MHRIFIVDDEEIVIEGISTIIERYMPDCVVTGSATDGISARNEILEKKPDVLVTDIRIPGMDGLSLIEDVRQFLPDMICIVISGYMEFEYARRALQMGVKDYIDKPVTIEKLKKSIENLGRFDNVKKAEHEDVPDVKMTETGHSAIDRALAFINDNYDRDIGLSEVASVVDMNPAYLCVLFKENVGESFIKYLTKVRINKAKSLLASGMKVVDVSGMVGYNDCRYFCDIFKKHENMTPNEYKSTIRI
ncbi:MAG: response regulator [Clostridiales bacterium]|jgi:YesN/AraC family two-component response regulator|nr:response regulator [Clostridiales bacterium]